MSGQYSFKAAITGQEGYKVLREIAHSEGNGKSPSKIAEEIDKSKSHVTNVLKPLKDARIVKDVEERRDRSIYYRLSYDNLSKLFLVLLKENKFDNEEINWDSDLIIRDLIEGIDERLKEKGLVSMRQWNIESIGKEEVEKTSEFVKMYSFWYFYNNKHSTIRKMLLDDFLTGLHGAESRIYDANLPEYLVNFRNNIQANNLQDPSRSVVDALNKRNPLSDEFT
jgi:DNA-binding transcriptional ArsR family regulator